MKRLFASTMLLTGLLIPTLAPAEPTPNAMENWAFRPLSSPTPPTVRDESAVANPVDAFIQKRLEDAGIAPAGPADRRTLIRRATFDLTGLPPSPQDVEYFVNDRSENAYEQLIDRLLASPQYGERWGRHWLDVVRYADSDGFRADGYRPHAWRYRDWVVRAFNADMPYDQFMSWQIAGDELAPDEPDALIATGFLRHWPYEHNQRDVHRQWREILDEVTDTTGDAFLGLSMSCAKCHDHKFDPIPRVDYYKLRSFFAALFPDDQLVAATPAQKAQHRKAMAEWNAKTADLRRAMDDIREPIRRSVEKPAYVLFKQDLRDLLDAEPETLSPYLQQIRDLAHRQLRDTHSKISGKIKGDKRKRWEDLSRQLKDSGKPADLTPALAVRDIGPEAPPTRIPGKHEILEPGFLTALGDEKADIRPVPGNPNTTGRRSALARWLARGDNPLTTRVIVNRVWHYHFGVGIVSTTNDFGKQGQPPTHPQLLDWLTRRFVQDGWRFKKLHKLIMTSAAYRRAATQAPNEAAAKRDPDNTLLWRFRIRRLDGEQIRDAMLWASGELDLKTGGPGVSSSTPRRSIYLRMKRNSRPTMLAAFDGPDTFTSCARRETTTTAPQALMMINGSWAIDRGKALARRVGRTQDPVTAAFEHAFGRRPTPAEADAAKRFLSTQETDIARRDEAQPREHVLKSTGRKAHRVRSDRVDDQWRWPQSDDLPSDDFAIEAVVQLHSMYDDASVRTIVSRWDGNTNHAGWSLGVTSKRSRYTPGNLILQFVGANASGMHTYEVVPSGLKIDVGRPYYVAASIQLGETGKSGVTFYAQALDEPSATLQTAQAKHTVTDMRPDAELIVGGRDQITHHTWDGLIGEVRLSGGPLSKEATLLRRGSAAESVAVHWRAGVESAAQPRSAGAPSGADRTALVDFCHALINTNEFIYVD